MLSIFIIGNCVNSVEGRAGRKPRRRRVRVGEGAEADTLESLARGAPNMEMFSAFQKE